MKSDWDDPEEEKVEKDSFQFDLEDEGEDGISEERKYWEKYFDAEDEHLRQKERKKLKKKTRDREREF